MATEHQQRLEWLKALEAARREPVSPAEQERRRTATRRLRALRDSLPSIAPDTTGEYIRHIREAQDTGQETR